MEMAWLDFICLMVDLIEYLLDRLSHKVTYTRSPILVTNNNPEYDTNK